MEIQHGGGITPYFTTIINSTVPFCKCVNGTDSNLIFKWILTSITKTLPKGFFHPCPYFGVFEAYNVSLESSPMMSQFLKGRYKTKMIMFDDEDDNIITYNFGFEL